MVLMALNHLSLFSRFLHMGCNLNFMKEDKEKKSALHNKSLPEHTNHTDMRLYF